MTRVDLSGRMARCLCGRTEESNPNLAYFNFRGAGSQWELVCLHCGRLENAHPKKLADERRGCCNRFEPRIGGFETDTYYCGCRGWD